MLNQKSSRMTMAVILVAAVMAVAAGTAIASNMGFKINKGLDLTIAAGGQRGNNWLSIPYFNPYGTIGTMCAQTGLPSAGFNRATVTDINPVSGVSSTVTCGTAAANSAPITPGRGLRARNPFNAAPVVNSIIIVGSHNPALSLSIPFAGAGQIGRFWFAVPYHATAVTAADLCTQTGMITAGFQRGSITRLNSATGAFTSVTCGTGAAGTLSLVLGEALQLLQPQQSPTPIAQISFLPAHF